MWAKSGHILCPPFKKDKKHEIRSAAACGPQITLTSDKHVYQSEPEMIVISDLFFAAPPMRGSGRGLIAVLRQHESPHGARLQVQMEHCVTLAETWIADQDGICVSREET